MTFTEQNRLLKANDIRSLGSKVAFNLEDIQRRCDEFVQRARKEGRKLIEDAEKAAEAIRLKAHEAGRQIGLDAGIQETDTRIERRAAEIGEKTTAEKMQTVIPTLTSIAESLAAERDRWMIGRETDLIRMSVAIAEKIVRHKLEVDPDGARDLIIEAVHQVSGSGRLELRLNPGDLERLGTDAEAVIRSISCVGDVELIADPSISSGGCVIETQHGVVDATLEAKLERIASELIQISDE